MGEGEGGGGIAEPSFARGFTPPLTPPRQGEGNSGGVCAAVDAMHPAYSVIVFTTASGAGFGLLVWLALFGLLGLVPTERWLGLAGFALAFA